MINTKKGISRTKNGFWPSMNPCPSHAVWKNQIFAYLETIIGRWERHRKFSAEIIRQLFYLVIVKRQSKTY